MKKTSLQCLVLLMLLLLSLPARGQTPTAQQLSEQAREAFTRGEWLQASALYDRAYAVHPACEFHFNRGMAYTRADQPANAIRAYRDYLESACRGRVHRQVRPVLRLIAGLESQLAAAPPHVAVVPPPVEPPVVPPPVRRPVVTPPVVVPPAVEPPVVLRLPPPRVYRQQRRLTGLAYALWGVGAVGVGGGIYFLAAAANDRSLSTQNVEDPGRHARAADMGAAIGWVSVSVGAAAAATATLWWLLGPTDRIAVTADLGPRHLVLGATVRLP